MNKDHIEGTIDEAKGRLKDGVGGLTGDTKTQAEGKLDEMSGQAQQALGDAKDAAASIADRTAEAAAHAGETLRETAEAVRAKAGVVGGKVYEAGATAGGYVGSTVQEQPLLALIGVAAIGYLVGYLVHSPASPFATEPTYRRVIRRWS
jgi:uncharacterized protein YjbJ (UPF0337 family)